jgi:excisionase family DNA binding protein
MPDYVRRKPAQRAEMPPSQRLLVDRRNAAQYLSISQRSLDYLLANGELVARRIGARVLIPLAELQRYAQKDHRRLAS